MGKSAGKWASTLPLLPIKSYAAVEPELMKEIEKLQYRQPRPFLRPFATVSRFRSLISFFSLFLRPSLHRSLSLSIASCSSLRAHCLFRSPSLLFSSLRGRRTQIARQSRGPRDTRRSHRRNGRKKETFESEIERLYRAPIVILLGNFNLLPLSSK